MSLSGRGHRAFVVATIAAVMILSTVPTAASASALSDKRRQAQAAKARVAASQAALRATVERQGAAAAALDAIEASMRADSARLDELIARQDRLQARLQARAATLYRGGPLGFFEALARSGSLDELSGRWDALSRIARDDALTVRELKATRARIARAARDGLRRQATASARLRALGEATTRARADLADGQAEYADVTGEMAALERAASEPRPRPVANVTQAAPTPRGPGAPSGVGSGAWRTAVASMYGTSLYGRHTADGTVVGPDSMIVAHKTLPFGTIVEFSYAGRTAVARVADRGPFVAGREFDLGPGVARVLGFEGVHTVRYRLVGR